MLVADAPLSVHVRTANAGGITPLLHPIPRGDEPRRQRQELPVTGCHCVGAQKTTEIFRLAVGPAPRRALAEFDLARAVILAATRRETASVRPGPESAPAGRCRRRCVRPYGLVLCAGRRGRRRPRQVWQSSSGAQFWSQVRRPNPGKTWRMPQWAAMDSTTRDESEQARGSL